MADPATNAMAKLVLDDETGEMVSKSEHKKRAQKRGKKTAKAEAKKTDAPKPAKTNPTRQADETAPIDPEAMFKQGFLADVFNERPSNAVVTRFPPELNGYLHLGHSKAIAVAFGFAKYHGGRTILRFDDTNPDEEKQVYCDKIIEMVRWLGFTPDAITHSSDHFDKLYSLAIELIKIDKAYVCHCGEADIKLQRGGKDGKEGPRYRCEHAEQDISTNILKFQDMRDGKYAPQTAFLRMKQDITCGNPQMWDLAAYRIPKQQQAHVRAPDWKIFPTYDFTHCLCDSFEGITHSLCTTEFIMSRESYEWLNKSLGVYEPMQREFGRLNISGTVMSKRALRKLVDEGIVRGWDDPRIYTLIAIKRRGIPPGAILSFINELGVTTSRSIISIARFEQTIRKYLENTVPRLMLVLDPIPVTINMNEEVEVNIPYSAKDPSFGSHKVPFTRTVYIDRSDFREEDSKDYYRLAPGKSVGLFKTPYSIKATSFTKDEVTGLVTGVTAEVDETTKPKTYIQWVPSGAGSVPVEARVHNALFKSDDPSATEGGFMNDINPNSEVIHKNALLEKAGFEEIKRKAPWPATVGEERGSSGPESIRFQGMRVGYFAVDSDSTDDKIVLNRIVSLKEDSGKS